jgi:hypothetical protein
MEYYQAFFVIIGLWCVLPTLFFINSMESFLVLFVIMGSITGLLAIRKNRNGLAWALLGVLFLFPTLVVLSFMDFLCPKCNNPISKNNFKNQTCPNCDLMKELGISKGQINSTADPLR